MKIFDRVTFSQRMVFLMSFFVFLVVGVFWLFRIRSELLPRFTADSVLETTPLAGAEIDNDYQVVAVQLVVSDRLSSIDQFSLRLSPVVLGRQEIDSLNRVVRFVPEARFEPGRDYTAELWFGEKLVYSWTFRTQRALSSPETVTKLKQFTDEEYPLLPFLPKETADYRLEYVGRRKLQVTFKGPRSAALEAEIFAWAAYYGVEPETHEWVWVE